MDISIFTIYWLSPAALLLPAKGSPSYPLYYELSINKSAVEMVHTLQRLAGTNIQQTIYKLTIRAFIALKQSNTIYST